MIEAKKYLKSFKARENKIALKIARVKALRDKLTSLSVPMDKEQVSHTKNVSIMADTIAMIADIEKEIDQQSCELVEAQKEAFRFLDQIPSESASYLINRFFVGMTITEIGRLTVPEKLKQFVNYTTIQTGVHIAVTGVMWVGLGLMAISGTVGLIRRRRKTK